jgi:Delta3-Delta2-enoyl-CoA isomerase
MAGVQVNIADGIATITFDRPQALNAITADDYEAFAEALFDIDKRPDVSVSPFHLLETENMSSLIHR